MTYHVDQPISNTALQQIHEIVHQALEDIKEPYRINVRRGENAEVLRAYTVSTDHALRFCARNKTPDVIQLSVKKFTTVFDNEDTAGWGIVMNIDLPVNSEGQMSLQSLAHISSLINDWLKPSPTNVRSPRSTYPCRDKADTPPSKWMAATFIIDDVQIKTEAGSYEVTFRNSRYGLQVVLKDEKAMAFSAPDRTVGCRVVIHQSGSVRIMRTDNFSKLYHLA